MRAVAPTFPTLYDYLVRNASFFTSRIAVTVDDTSISFGALKGLVDHVAALLDTFNIHSGDRVILWEPNSIEWIAVFLAAASRGVVVVPVNTRLTSAELKAVTMGAGARLVFAAHQYRQRRYFEEAEAAIDVGTERPMLVRIETGVPPSKWIHTGAALVSSEKEQISPELFSIKFTSGTTTGSPSGVTLTHQNYISAAEYSSRMKFISHNTDFVSAAPFFHTSGSMHCIAVCMVAGATLHSMSVWDPERYVDLVQKFRATVSHAPHVIDIFESEKVSLAREKLKTLTTSTMIGSPQFLARVVEELDIPNIFEPYGMTETCGMFTMCSADDPLELRLRSQGRPRIGNWLRIADPVSDKELTPGSVGEIQMKGVGITPGYYKDPMRNSEVFTADRWFKSGDLGKCSPFGELEFVSRIRDIIKTGGENLTAAEVEDALMGLGIFKEAVVFGFPDPRLDEVPVAVVSGVRAEETDWTELVRSLRKILADFKVPHRIYLVSELPRNVTSKIQKPLLLSQIRANAIERVV